MLERRASLVDPCHSDAASTMRDFTTSMSDITPENATIRAALDAHGGNHDSNNANAYADDFFKEVEKNASRTVLTLAGREQDAKSQVGLHDAATGCTDLLNPDINNKQEPTDMPTIDEKLKQPFTRKPDSKPQFAV